jgi:N-acetylmuramoyl-L-alanine amidase
VPDWSDTNIAARQQPAAASGSDSPQPPGGVGPIGAGEYLVRQGDCLCSIAIGSGHFWQTIWEDPGNAELREHRKDPYVLLPGDHLSIPPLRRKDESGQTEMRHRFVRKGQPEKLRVRILRDGKPRKNQPYTVEVNGAVYTGNTDPDGKLECPIPPHAPRAKLRIGTEPDIDEYDLKLGEIDPIDEVSGIQGRLNNLGFDCGAVDGIWGPLTEKAVREFQKHCQIEVTGQVDEATRQRLGKAYGC